MDQVLCGLTCSLTLPRLGCCLTKGGERRRKESRLGRGFRTSAFGCWGRASIKTLLLAWAGRRFSSDIVRVIFPGAFSNIFFSFEAFSLPMACCLGPVASSALLALKKDLTLPTLTAFGLGWLFLDTFWWFLELDNALENHRRYIHQRHSY